MEAVLEQVIWARGHKVPGEMLQQVLPPRPARMQSQGHLPVHSVGPYAGPRAQEHLRVVPQRRQVIG